MSGSMRVRFGVVPVALAATGCAVLTVEVDVYKGPLANQGEVQMAQVVTMAMGTKPLLVALRDDLEWGDDAAVGAPHSFRKQTWYREAWIAPEPAGSTRSPLRDEDARRVNDVLRLYMDLSRLGPQISAVRDAAGRLETELAARTRLGAGDAAVAAALRSEDGRVTAYTESGGASVAALAEACAAFVGGGSGAAPGAERAVLVRARSVKGPIAKAGDPAADAVKRLEESPWVARHWGDAVTEPSNAVFATLADPAACDAIAGVLFANEKLRSELSRALRERAESYLGCRRAIRATVLAALDLIEAIDDSDEFDNLAKARILGRLGEPMGTLLQPRFVSAALGASGDATGLVERTSAVPFAADDWSDAAFAARAGAIVVELSTPGRAASAARALRLADASIRSTAPADARLAPQAAREFGVAAGPSTVAGEATGDGGTATGSLAAAAAALIEGASQASPLDGGRTTDGLETRIRRYLDAYYANPLADWNADNDLNRERGRLLHALIEFGNKVMVMANDAAIGRARDSTSLVSYGRNFVHHVTGGLPARNLSADFIRTLQAAGNSIIAQADPLYRLMDHRRRLDGIRQDAVAIARGAGVPETSTAGVDPLATFDVLDAQLSKLEAEAVGSLASAPDDVGRQATLASRRRARQLVHDLRMRSIFVPSPAAYLRTSYTSSAVQDSQGITWSNDLRSHFDHAWPLEQISRWFESDTRAVLAEVDKQYWQNINRVKVEAAGNTNYVIAKDDIGNWYVKGFEADPRPLIDAAKVVAGSAIGAGGFVPPQAPAPADGTQPKFSREAVVAGFASARKAFDTATDAHVGALGGVAKDLQTRIAAAWQGRAAALGDRRAAEEELQSMLSDERAASAQHLAAVSSMQTVSAEGAFATDERVSEALLSVVRYAERLDVLLRGRVTAAGSQKQTADAAATKAEDDRNAAEGRAAALTSAIEADQSARTLKTADVKSSRDALTAELGSATPRPDEVKKLSAALHTGEAELESLSRKIADDQTKLAAEKRAEAAAAAAKTKAEGESKRAAQDERAYRDAADDAKAIVLDDVRSFIARRKQALAELRSGIEAYGVTTTK